MLIIWKAEFDGDEKDLAKLDKLNQEITKELGGKILGPYLPQDADLMYIFDVPEFEWLNKAGRRFYEKVMKSGIKITPLRYEVAVTLKEFWGKK